MNKRFYFLFLIVSIINAQNAQNNKVGINTKNPTTTLEVDSKTKDDSGFKLSQLHANTPVEYEATPIGVDDFGKIVTVTATGWLVTGNSSINPSDHFLGTKDNRSLIFRTNNLERIMINPNGIMGIGTQRFPSNGLIQGDPETYRLFVKDGIRAERVKVDVATASLWADYVFDENYKLISLQETEKFIKENKHLPNVPSADQIVNQGLDIAKISSKLLEKIEELTLHLIELNKENKNLSERIEKLENEKK